MKKVPALPPGIWRDPLIWFACGLGTGASRIAPGTFGTLVALPVYWAMQGLSLWWYLAIVLAMFLFGIPLCSYAARRIGVHDHSGIVWDEMVGYLLTMTLAPTGWLWMLVGFVWFRLFDIWKPWPIRLLDQQLGGGFGIMVDDLLAGIYAAVLLYISHSLYINVLV